MGMRPPSNDTDEPTSVEFGIAAVDARLDEFDIAYPVTKPDLERRIGHLDIAYDMKGHTLSMRDALDKVDRDEFADEQALLNALHPVFERRREKGSVLDRIRSSLPF
ncbi:hypothetical protein [Haloarchaeobius litoreus]|uniref:Uncharacterized protein n=1 Tax=Haloarchaeobius litoreus TaxID=755306 RepID=A0ABD6DL60_9EURY|nr:hypothetical protein [Haloarchaeobius litoreus]